MQEQTFSTSDVCSLLEDLREQLLHHNAIVRNLRVTCSKPNPEEGIREKLQLAIILRKRFNVWYGKLYQAMRSYECGNIDVNQLEDVYENTREEASISVSR